MSVITIDPSLEKRVCLAILQAEDIVATGDSPELNGDLAALSRQLAEAFPKPADALERFTPARELYRAVGLDPTKGRPSSEALTRRIIRGQGLYRINRVVDTCNLCSLDFALPIGLYDNDNVAWPATLRLGREGEGYQGLGKDHINVAGRWTLADQEGPFGNPSADSFRSRIRDDTHRCTFVIFAPTSYARERLQGHLTDTGERLQRYAGAHVVHEEIVG